MPCVNFLLPRNDSPDCKAAWSPRSSGAQQVGASTDTLNSRECNFNVIKK